MSRKSTKRKSTSGSAGQTVTSSPFPIDIDDLTPVEEFLRTGESEHNYLGNAVVAARPGNPFLCRDGELIEVHTDSRPDANSDGDRVSIVTECSLETAGGCRGRATDYNDKSHELPSAVLIPGGPKGWKNTLIICGDDEGMDVVEVSDETKAAATISFLCLSRFIDDAAPLKLAEMMHSGKIKLLDFTADETRSAADDDKKKFEEKKPLSPPELGFTYLSVGNMWHRAATVLLRYGRMRIILGQDEGTYFGCELKGTPNTVKEAFRSLIPEHIRKVRGVRRQGEWFVVPVAAKNVPVVTECVALGNDEIDLQCD